MFEGDTVVACARFDDASINGTVVLEVETEKGEVMRQALPISMPLLSGAEDRLSTVARVAASARLKELDDGAGRATVLRYRLVSPWTNWLVIAERPDEEKAQDLPALRKVPQTLAAGWGGVGVVDPFACMDVLMAPRARSMPNGIPQFSLADFAFSVAEAPHQAPDLDHPEPYRRLLTLIENDPTRLEATRALDLLREAGFASEFDDLFRVAADLGLNVEVIAAMTLAGLLAGPLGEHLSAERQGAAGSLQAYAGRATDALREITRDGSAPARVTEEAVWRDILRLEQAPDVEESPERVAGIRDLLDKLQECQRRSAEQLNDCQAAHA